MTEHAGMVPAEEWAQTDVHAASSYFCQRCAKEFTGPTAPQDLYTHLEFCEPPEEIGEGSRIRLTRAVGTVEKIIEATAYVKWDSGAKSAVPVDWLNRK